MTVPGSILIFSIATNGYDRHFAGLLQGQVQFARAIGAEYWVAREAPPWGISAHDSAWMKIPLIEAALQRGFEWVLFLDADCEIMSVQSPVAAFAAEPQSIFVCHDFSHRINSAVLLVRNTSDSRRLFRKLWWSAFVPSRFFPVGDRNLYENGHVIHYLKGQPAVRIMDPRWNCSIFKEVSDPYIFHHGGTPVRATHQVSRSHWRVWRQKATELTTGFRLPWHYAYYRRSLPRPAPLPTGIIP